MVAQQVVGSRRPNKMGGEEKLIIRSEKARFIDILSMLLLRRRRPITSYRFVEAGDRTTANIIGGAAPGEDWWLVALTEVIQKALAAAYYPALYTGAFLEFLLNFIVLNNGVFGIVWNIFRCKLVIPLNREAPNFRSMIALIDGRTALKPTPAPPPEGAESTDEKQYLVDMESGAPLVVQQQHANAPYYSILETTMMAAKIAYENAAYIENVVNNVWKFHFVGFYSCWNKFVGDHTTQAFVFTNQATDATAVVVSFRGTEPFNTRDWSTDVNLSWLGMGVMGHVHVGFLKALGLQEEDGEDAGRAFPKDSPPDVTAADKPLAYVERAERAAERAADAAARAERAADALELAADAAERAADAATRAERAADAAARVDEDPSCLLGSGAASLSLFRNPHASALSATAPAPVAAASGSSCSSSLAGFFSFFVVVSGALIDPEFVFIFLLD